MLQQEENGIYDPYTYALPYSYAPSLAGEVVDAPPVTPTPLGQDAFQPPDQPTEPIMVLPAPPPKRRGRAGAIFLLAVVLTLVFGVGLFSGWEFVRGSSNGTSATTVTTSSSASSSSATTLEALQEAAISKVEPAVVELKVITAQGEQIGSGVIIDANGDIVTNNHVVNGEQSITVVLSTGATEQAQLMGTNSADDLAVVRIQPFAHMTIAQIGNSSQLVVGQEVLAIGNPLGITETATKGMVSALNRSVTESVGTTITQAIQTDAAVNPGNSGGALINLQGQLVGIPTLTAVNTESNTAANGVSFAIPSNLVKTVVAQILAQAN